MKFVRITTTLCVDDDGWDALMEDTDVYSQVGADMKAATAKYDVDHVPLVQIDGWEL